jgi:hypothetical protein
LTLHFILGGSVPEGGSGKTNGFSILQCNTSKTLYLV